MILLRLITWPYVRTHALRTTLTAAGIVLGIAVFVGMNGANQSVLSAFAQTIDRIAGKTELQVSAGETGLAESVLEQVQAVPSVAVAVPIIEAVVDTNIRGQGSLLVLGVDLTGDQSLREYDLQGQDGDVIDDPLVFLAQADSVIVSRTFADRNGLAVGSHLTLGTSEGDRQFTIRGIMNSGGLTSAFGGNLAVMDIYAAQKMFGRNRTFDRIDLAAAPGISLATCIADLRKALGEGFQIETPANRGQHFESIIAAYSMMMTASSVFAMFIGMFIIYNAFAIAVTERRKEIGILRALGATRGQIQRLFLFESAITGIVGSIFGLAAGVLIARVIASVVGVLISSASGVAQSPTDLLTNPTFLGIAFAVGVATSIVAAIVPARAAARVDPIQALQKGAYQVLSAGENRARVTAAVVLGVTSVVCLVFGGTRGVFYASYILVMLVALLLTPVLCGVLSRLLRPVLRWVRPVEGTLAADSLVQSPRRTSVSVAALMLSIAMVIAFAGMARASFGSITDWVDVALNADLFVLPSHEVNDRSIRFPASMGPELSSVPGVRLVQAVRQGRVLLNGSPVLLLALDFSSVSSTSRPKAVDGDVNEMIRVVSAGQGAMISENLAQLRQLRRGDIIELPAPDGLLRLPVVGIITHYADQRGVVLIDDSLRRRHWQDDSANFYRVYLSPAAQMADVKSAILERYAGQRRVFVLNNDDMKRFVLNIAGQWFRLTYLQIAVAVFVAILGIVNTLTVSITDRRRELGVLRAVGGLRGQIQRTIWLEAMGIGLLGVVLGIGVGSINLYYLLEIVRRDVIGMRFPYQFPAAVAAGVVPMMLTAAFVAAVWPARAAVHAPLVEALEHE